MHMDEPFMYMLPISHHWKHHTVNSQQIFHAVLPPSRYFAYVMLLCLCHAALPLSCCFASVMLLASVMLIYPLSGSFTIALQLLV